MDVKCKPRAKRAEYVETTENPAAKRRIYESEFIFDNPIAWLHAQRINSERRIQKKLIQHFCFIDGTDAIALTDTLVHSLVTHKRHRENI